MGLEVRGQAYKAGVTKNSLLMGTIPGVGEDVSFKDLVPVRLGCLASDALCTEQ